MWVTHGLCLHGLKERVAVLVTKNAAAAHCVYILVFGCVESPKRKVMWKMKRGEREAVTHTRFVIAWRKKEGN